MQGLTCTPSLLMHDEGCNPNPGTQAHHAAVPGEVVVAAVAVALAVGVVVLGVVGHQVVQREAVVRDHKVDPVVRLPARQRSASVQAPSQLDQHFLDYLCCSTTFPGIARDSQARQASREPGSPACRRLQSCPKGTWVPDGRSIAGMQVVTTDSTHTVCCASPAEQVTGARHTAAQRVCSRKQHTHRRSKALA